jgi:hypothetical protein
MLLCFVIYPTLSFGKECTPKTLNPLVGLPLKEFEKREARTYRKMENEEWQTFNCGSDAVTFHFNNGKVVAWKMNDRPEIVEEYLSEFCSQAFIQSYPKIYGAIKAALTKIPQDAFLAVTDRARPVLFTETHYAGLGRFANSSNILVADDDAPAMSQGLTMIKLSVELEDKAESSEEIEGIILHELAHRVLEHAKKKLYTCQMEREANHLVKSWGYEKEYLKAKERFGDKTRTDAEKCPE